MKPKRSLPGRVSVAVPGVAFHSPSSSEDSYQESRPSSSDCLRSNKLDEEAQQGQLQEVKMVAGEAVRGHRAQSSCNGGDGDLSGSLFVTDRLLSAGMMDLEYVRIQRESRGVGVLYVLALEGQKEQRAKESVLPRKNE